MSREELEDLADAKQTTPDALLRLMNDQGYFEALFITDSTKYERFFPIKPGDVLYFEEGCP